MLHAVLESRALGNEPEQLEVPQLPKNIAPVPRPPKEELLARHASRFGKKKLAAFIERFIHSTFTLC